MLQTALHQAKRIELIVAWHATFTNQDVLNYGATAWKYVLRQVHLHSCALLSWCVVAAQQGLPGRIHNPAPHL